MIKHYVLESAVNYNALSETDKQTADGMNCDKDRISLRLVITDGQPTIWIVCRLYDEEFDGETETAQIVSHNVKEYADFFNIAIAELHTHFARLIQ